MAFVSRIFSCDSREILSRAAARRKKEASAFWGAKAIRPACQELVDFDGSNNLYWSPDKTCAVNYVYGYGYHGLELAYYQGSDLRVVNYTKSFMPDEFTGVYWIDNCIAVVAVKSDIGTTYYKLDKDSDIPLKIIKPNISKLKKGEEFDWPLKNIYFTVKEPSKK